MYAALNFLTEAWHQVVTNSEPEAVIDKIQGKGLKDYRELMTGAFKQKYEMLKPGRWITVEAALRQLPDDQIRYLKLCDTR